MGERGAGSRCIPHTGRREPACGRDWIKAAAGQDAGLQRRIGEEVGLLLRDHGGGETSDTIHDVLHQLIGLLDPDGRISPVDLLLIDALRDRAERARAALRH